MIFWLETIYDSTLADSNWEVKHKLLVDDRSCLPASGTEGKVKNYLWYEWLKDWRKKECCRRRQHVGGKWQCHNWGHVEMTSVALVLGVTSYFRRLRRGSVGILDFLVKALWSRCIQGEVAQFLNSELAPVWAVARRYLYTRYSGRDVLGDPEWRISWRGGSQVLDLLEVWGCLDRHKAVPCGCVFIITNEALNIVSGEIIKKIALASNWAAIGRTRMEMCMVRFCRQSLSLAFVLFLEFLQFYLLHMAIFQSCFKT